VWIFGGDFKHNVNAAVWNHARSKALDERIETLSGVVGFTGEPRSNVAGKERPYLSAGRKTEVVPE
jgi:hypothetical protein